MTINDKIKQILIDKNFSPSYFADEIGVQRSSISHILSGRNRPSFDIIQKIIRRFPELGYEWIMEEDNQPAQVARSAARSLAQPLSPYTERPVSVPALSSPVLAGGFRSQRTEIPPTEVMSPLKSDTPSDTGTPSVPTGEKRVERILIFYSDGSFREYTPAL